MAGRDESPAEGPVLCTHTLSTTDLLPVPPGPEGCLLASDHLLNRHDMLSAKDSTQIKQQAVQVTLKWLHLSPVMEQSQAC
jgi:hypothetical protein